MKVLVTGASGALARKVIGRLVSSGHTVLGIDRRPWPDAPEGVQMFRVDLRKRPAEDVFRTHQPDAAIHMATVTYVSARAEERSRINWVGPERFGSIVGITVYATPFSSVATPCMVRPPMRHSIELRTSH